MTVFACPLERIERGVAVVQRDVGDVMDALQLPQHLERADLATLVQRVQ